MRSPYHDADTIKYHEIHATHSDEFHHLFILPFIKGIITVILVNLAVIIQQLSICPLSNE